MDQGHTTKLKTIWLACEMFREDQFGLMIYDHITKQPWPYDFNDYPLTQVLVERMREWYNNYYPLTSSTAQELEKESALIDTLDKEGIEILKQIGHELEGVLSCKLEYYSRGRDRTIYSMEN